MSQVSRDVNGHREFSDTYGLAAKTVRLSREVSLQAAGALAMERPLSGGVSAVGRLASRRLPDRKVFLSLLGWSRASPRSWGILSGVLDQAMDPWSMDPVAELSVAMLIYLLNWRSREVYKSIS